jgi:hypothetical protein
MIIGVSAANSEVKFGSDARRWWRRCMSLARKNNSRGSQLGRSRLTQARYNIRLKTVDRLVR